MKTFRLVLVSALLCAACPVIRADEIGMELLPKGRPFQLTAADPREIRMALTFAGDTRIDALIGNYFSLLALKPKSGDDWVAHLGLEGAGYFTMRQAEDRFPLETVDGLIGVYAEGASGAWQYQTRFTHISAHLADGSIGPAIAYSREFLTVRGAYVPSPDLQLYLGGHYLTHTVPVLQPWEIQWGGAYYLPLGGTKLVPFTGLDAHWNQESSIAVSVSAQLGVALRSAPAAYRSFRFFLSYYSGADPRGQFYNVPLTIYSLGIEMQI